MYPKQPRRLNPNQEDSPAVARPATPARPAIAPQVVGGAPTLDPATRSREPLKTQPEGITRTIGVLPIDPNSPPPIVETREVLPVAPDRIDYDQPIPAAQGSGGPERWDTPNRTIADHPNAGLAASVLPHPYKADDIMTDHPEAVASFRAKLADRRQKLSPKQIAESDFWRRFDTEGQPFVAQLIGDVMGMLTEDQRRENESARQLSPAQQGWVRDHPLTRWMDWT